MSPLVTNLLIALMAAYAAVVLYEIVVSRRFRAGGVQLALLLLVIVILNVTVGFPTAVIAFGGPSPVVAIVVMLGATMLGIFSHVVMRSRKFSVAATLKPLLLSPIVLLPLLGAIERNVATIDVLQLISLSFLAFQNGYFWREVISHAKPRT